jgi:chromosome segregation ATPase
MPATTTRITQDKSVLAAQAALDQARTKARETRLAELMRTDRGLLAAQEAVRLAKKERHVNNLGIPKLEVHIDTLRAKLADAERELAKKVEARKDFDRGVREAEEELEAAKNIVRARIDPEFENTDDKTTGRKVAARK